jgi:CCR4-NOT transcription complex subunit 6
MNLAREYGPATPACPVASDFETKNFEQIVANKTHVRLLSWPRDADGDLTFSRLTHVVCLDLHALGMTFLPSEIGLCTELECLDIRDNYLQFLPPELSQCLKMKTLLFSGNSLPYHTQIQSLIELRRLNQSVGGSPAFRWNQPNGTFTIVSWNILAQHEATQLNFPKCPARYLKLDYRVEVFVHTVINLKPQIVCIQEVESSQLDLLVERMKAIGYGCSASFASRPLRPGIPIVGVATFYLKSRLTLEKTIAVSFSDLPPTEFVSKLQLLASESVFQVSVVRMQTQSIFLINTGLHPCPYDKDVLVAQVHTIAERLDGLSGQAVICGSFGFTPGSPPHKLMTTGEEPQGRYKLKRTWRSAYAESPATLEFTEWNDDEFLVKDYIWHSPLLSPIGWVMGAGKEETLNYHITAPNLQWTSNHVPIGVALELRTAGQD